MIPRTSTHEEVWLLLPWLANGRLPAAQRPLAEEHVRECPECTRELESQRLLCATLTEPERITYAPGPSFRKLMDRIDGTPRHAPYVSRPARSAVGGALTAAWRPPGLAWAATFALAVCLGLLVATSYQWSKPNFRTVTTDPVRVTPDVLHIAFDRSLPVGEAEEVLRSAGARVVEGPSSSGIFGVAPVTLSAAPPGAVSPEMRAVAARLRADPRVRWIEPLAAGQTPEPSRGASSQDP
jgi:hypothetical protein